MKVPVIELDECILCGVCNGICPDVFVLNEAGYVEVMDLDEYPVEDVLEAVKYCPTDCILYDDDNTTY